MNKLFYFIVILLLLACGALSYFVFKGNKKIAFVTIANVYDEFNLKKELEEKYKKIQIYKQSYLDSLKLNIQSMGAITKENDPVGLAKFEESRKLYLLKENQFEKENENLNQVYTEQIWKQLNQYLEDFGHENAYDFIIGANGQGNLIYAGEKNDITKEMIKYVNNKYVGKK